MEATTTAPSVPPTSTTTPPSRPTAPPLTCRRRELAKNAVGLVKRFASHLAALYYGLVGYGELVALGQLGLVEAATRFDHDRGVPFEGFVAPRVRGAMLDGIRAEARARRNACTLRQIASEEFGGTEEPISDEPVSAAGPVSGRETVAKAAATLVAELAIAFEAPENIEDRIDEARRRALLAEAVATIPEADRAVVQRICAGSTVPEIAHELGCSLRTAERRKKAILEVLVARVKDVSR